MTQVETLTGINAHTLRIWERRYDFMKAHRTDTNIRYYSGDQLKTLLNVAILMRNGYKVSKINNMSSSDIIHKILEIELNNKDDQSDEINLLTIAMLSYNEEDFSKIFQRSILRVGMLNTIVNLIYPFLNQVGVLWGASKVSPPQEHFISNLIRQKLISAIDTIPLASATSKGILFFLMEGEDHELGLLLSSYIAKDLGWKIIYLGQRTPLENLNEVILKTNTKYLMTLFTTPRSDDFLKTLTLLQEETNTCILYAGNPIFAAAEKTNNNVQYIKSPNDLILKLKE